MVIAHQNVCQSQQINYCSLKKYKEKQHEILDSEGHSSHNLHRLIQNLSQLNQKSNKYYVLVLPHHKVI